MSGSVVGHAKLHRVGSPAWKAILLAIAEHCRTDGTACYARYGTLAEEAECSIETVKRAVPAMLAAGVLRGRPGMLSVEIDRVIVMSESVTTTPRKCHSDTVEAKGKVSPRHLESVTVTPASVTVTPRTKPSTNRPLTVQPPLLTIPSQQAPKARRNGLADDDPRFVAFYAAYPKRAERGDARKAFAVALTKAPAEVLIAGAERYRDDPTRKPDFTKNPATWLNKECWNDEPAQPSSRQAPLPPRVGGVTMTGQW